VAAKVRGNGWQVNDEQSKGNMKKPKTWKLKSTTTFKYEIDLQLPDTSVIV
jgi:hypothetical protein